jgi:hypothetical protein
MESGDVSERIFQDEDEQWYYRTRGNHAIGPFPNQHLAEQALAKKIRSWAGRADPKAVWPRHLQPSRIWRRSGTTQQ